jgi:hypothetical protein
MKKLFIKLLLLISLCVLTFTGCEFSTIEKSEKKNWTLIFYMCGDNNLAPSALRDINEMEAANVDYDKVNILALTDLSNEYVESSSSGSRLFQIQKDNNGLNSKIVSNEIHSKQLGLSKKYRVNLNMASSKVLSDYISFCKEYFPAEHYGLVIWGHGSGWRSVKLSDEYSPSRAVAFDDSSMQFMSVPVLASCISKNFKHSELDFIGFDTCFGSELEVLYELKNCGQYFAGVEGLEGSDGWNYTKWLSSFDFEETSGGYNMALALEEQFIEAGDHTFAAIDLSKVNELFCQFEAFCQQVCPVIKDAESQKNLLNGLRKDVISFYQAGIESDYVVDLIEFSKLLVKEDYSYSKYSTDLFNSVKEAIVSGKKSNVDRYPVGILLCSIDENGKFISKYSDYYVNGSGVLNQSKFVLDSNWYVPSAERKGSVLDRLFCTTFFSEGDN